VLLTQSPSLSVLARGIGFQTFLGVLLDHSKRCAAHRGYEVAVRPERWKAALQPRELGAKRAGAPPLHGLHEPMDAILRMDLHKRVHVVWHHLEFYQLDLTLRGYLLKGPLQELLHAMDEDLAPALRTPDNVVLARKDDVPTALVLHAGMHPVAVHSTSSPNPLWSCLRTHQQAAVPPAA